MASDSWNSLTDSDFPLPLSKQAPPGYGTSHLVFKHLQAFHLSTHQTLSFAKQKTLGTLTLHPSQHPANRDNSGSGCHSPRATDPDMDTKTPSGGSQPPLADERVTSLFFFIYLTTCEVHVYSKRSSWMKGD